MLAWLAKRRSMRELPAAAARLGLRHCEAEYTDKSGTMSGVYRDHSVLVRPDKPAIIVEYRFRIEGLDLSTWSDPRLRRPADFHSDHQDFDRLFRKRKLPSAVAKALSAEPAFFAQAVAFKSRWGRTIAQLDFSQVSFSAWIRERGLQFTYITAAELDGMLPAMVDIAEILETACGRVTVGTDG